MGIFSRILGNAGKVDSEKLLKKYDVLLTADEVIDTGFKLMRDTFIFTNKRLIMIDVQGVAGKKVNYFSLGYKHISRISVESAGSLELDAELKIWVSGGAEPSIVQKFDKSVNVYEIQKILVKYAFE